MPTLEVPGAILNYEAIGQGPPLLCIAGANGDLEIWKRFAEQLKDRFTVIIYDRRGFSRSYLQGRQDYAHRLETDADDVAALIKHVSTTVLGKPAENSAYVIGNSSGAIVSLQVAIRHPDILKVVAVHEPPAMHHLEDYEELYAMQKDIYQTYREAGIPPALDKFSAMIKASDESFMVQRSFDARNGPYISSNAQYWFERELLCYPPHQFDLDTLKARKGKLLLLNGEDSDREALQFRGNVEFGKLFGLSVEILPGAHVGFASAAKPFAMKFIEVLETNGFL